MKFAACWFVSITTVPIMESSKYNMKAFDALLTDCMGPLISEN
jgi:hypothetical protein